MNIRIGKVCNVNSADKTVRVIFEEESLTSGWLKVLKTPPIIIPVFSEGQDKDEPIKKYRLDIQQWMPEIGNIVLCIYGEGFNADGYVIGGL